MIKSVLRASSWRTLSSKPIQNVSSRRFLATARPIKKSRKLKTIIFKSALIIGGIYYYNSNDIFEEEKDEAEGLEYASQETTLPTINAIVEYKRQIKTQQETENESLFKLSEKPASQDESNSQNRTKNDEKDKVNVESSQTGQEGAFDPETGTINWDCPCLGGMAHGPCGEEFKDAFSCFVHSKEEPKGVDCIDRFKTMQNCFRKHPEIYGAELEDEGADEADDEMLVNASEKSNESPPPSLEQSGRSISQATTPRRESYRSLEHSTRPSSQAIATPRELTSQSNQEYSVTNINENVDGGKKDASGTKLPSTASN